MDRAESRLTPVDVAAGFAAPGGAYVVSASEFTARVRGLAEIFDGYLYPIKVNARPEIVQLAVEAGAGLDLCSAGDLEIALNAVASPPSGGAAVAAHPTRSFTSPNLGAALAQNLTSAGVTIDLDSAAQLAVLPAACRVAGVRICTADATSAYGSKFGVLAADVESLVQAIEQSGRSFTGLHIHESHAGRTPAQIAQRLRAVLSDVAPGAIAAASYVNIGGGWELSGNAGNAGIDLATAADVESEVRTALGSIGFTGKIVCEPGEWAVGRAGYLVATVAAVKVHPVDPARTVVVLDTATPVPCRPSAGPYDIYREGMRIGGSAHADVVARETTPGIAICDFYGSANTGLDTVGLGVSCPLPQVGDTVVVSNQGAYAYQLTSSFNERPLPGFYLVN